MDIEAGKEIFNTYGELSNAELLRNHGFALPPVELREAGVDTVSVFLGAELPPERWTLLRETGIVEESCGGEVVFGPEGCVNAEFAGLLLALAAMSEEELEVRRLGISKKIASFQDKRSSEFRKNDFAFP